MSFIEVLTYIYHDDNLTVKNIYQLSNEQI